MMWIRCCRAHAGYFGRLRPAARPVSSSSSSGWFLSLHALATEKKNTLHLEVLNTWFMVSGEKRNVNVNHQRCFVDSQWLHLLFRWSIFHLVEIWPEGIGGTWTSWSVSIEALCKKNKKSTSLSTCSTDSSFTTIIISHFLKFAFCPPGIILSSSFASAPLVGSFQTWTLLHLVWTSPGRCNGFLCSLTCAFLSIWPAASNLLICLRWLPWLLGDTGHVWSAPEGGGRGGTWRPPSWDCGDEELTHGHHKFSG